MIDPFIEYAQKAIRTFLKDKNKSLNWLSNNCGVAYHKLHRTANATIGALSYFDAKLLLNYIEGEERTAGLLREFFPAESAEFGLKKDQDDILEQDRLLNAASESELSMLVYLFVHTSRKPAVTREEIRSSLGPSFVAIADELNDAGVFSLNESGFVSNVQKVRTASEKTAKREAQTVIGLLDYHKRGTFIRTDHRRYSDQGRRDIYKAIVTCDAELQRINSDPEMEGDHLIGYTLAVGGLRGEEQQPCT